MNDQPAVSATKLALCLVLALSWIQLAASPVRAQTAFGAGDSALASLSPDLTVGPGGLVTLRGNTRPEANGRNDRGRVSDGLMLNHLMLQLRRSPEQEQALEQFISELHDPASPFFHQWITGEQFGQSYGVAPADVAKVTNWLESQGFKVNLVYPNQMVIDFTGSAGQIRQAFHTEIHNLLVNGQAHIANMSDPQIPSGLASLVRGVVSLNDFMPHPALRWRANYTIGTSTYAVVPADLAKIYNFNPAFTAGTSGQGQTIVVVEDTNLFSNTDWTTFRSTFGLTSAYPLGALTTVHPNFGNNCSDPGVNGDDGEAAVDVEWATAGAPSATIELASCADTSTNFGGFIALQNLLNASSTPPAIVSISYGDSESLLGTFNAYISGLYQQAVTEGVSVFVSSGDQGAAVSDAGSNYSSFGITSSGFTTTPYNVSVGGTDFADTYQGKNTTYWATSANNTTTYGSALSYVPEIPWNNSCASVLIADYHSILTTYGSTGLCNNSSYTNLINIAAGSGGPSGCATGAPDYPGLISGTCAGYPKPSWQSGLFGNPNDGVRDVPDVSLFAANGIWNHYYVLCYTDPTYGGKSCSGAPSTWSGAGGTSISAPIWAAIQALANQASASRWGNPNPAYYALAATEYGASGSTTCSSNLGNAVASNCIFYDVTPIPLIHGGSGTGGDIDLPCSGMNCYRPSGTYGVLSTAPQTVTYVMVTFQGSGYGSAPSCTLSGGGGSGATCSAITTGVVTQVTLSNGGSGYTSTSLPTCTLTGGGGTGATCAVVQISSGAVASTGLVLTNYGSGYTSAPTCTIGPPPVGIGHTTATCTATEAAGIGASLTAGGSGYTTLPQCILSGGGGTGATCLAEAVNTSGSYQPAFATTTGWDFATGIGTVNVSNLVTSFTSFTSETLSTTSLPFGNQAVGTTSAASSVTVTNTGTKPLTFTSISITGTNSADFSQTNTCGSPVAANGTCTISVTFTPSLVGAESAAVTLSNNAPGSPQSVSLTGTGTAATGPVTFSPPSLTFTSQNVGTTSSAQSITMTNTGSASITSISISITGTNSGDFSQTNTCGTSLAVAANCAISVKFAPTTPGTRTASVSIADSLAGSPQTVGLTGTGSAPVAGLTPPGLGFSSQNVGTTSTGQPLTLNNSGNTALSITSIGFTGANAADFGQTNTCGTSVAAGASCTISVTFTPTGPGSRSATLTVTDNNNNVPGSQQNASMSGTGTGPAVSLSAPSIGFGNQSVGVASSAQSVTVTNTGNASLTFTSIAVTGANSADFAQTNTCGSPVAANGTCTISVTFTPSAAAAETAAVTLIDNAPGSPQAVSLTGTGVSGVSFSASSLTFTSQNVGTTSSAQSITMTNTGSASITSISISITGTNSADYAQTNTCGSSLAVAANCAISVKFAPTAPGTRTASVSIADSLPGSPQTVALTGTGSAPAVSLSSTTLTFASQGVATTSTPQSVTLTNTGNASLTIASIAVGGANAGDFAQTNTCGTSVAAAGTCTISVTFTPAATGSRAATVTITDNNNNVASSTQSVSLTGTGTAPVAGLTPPGLSFPSQNLNTTSSAQLGTLNNTGNAALSITSITFSGANAADFGQTNTCGTSVAAGASCTISVTFTPTAPGSRAASMIVTDNSNNAAGSQQSMSLSGTGTGAAVSLSAPSIGFGSQTVGVASSAQSVTVTNNGNASLTFTSIAVAGANSADFSLATNTCGSSVAAAGTCTLGVTFTPSLTGAETAAITLTDNAPGSPQSVSLTGTGVSGVSFSAPSLTFTSQNVGTTSSAQSVTMTNTGSASITSISISITGTNSGDYSQTNTCGTSLATAANCTISVTFAPTAAGTRTASVSIADSLPGSPQTVALTGTGSAPVASLSANSIAFGSQNLGSTSAAQSVTLTNTGNASLTIASIAVAGANAGDFAQTNTCGTSVAAAGTCTISVTFTPAATGSRAASVTITDNNNNVASSTQSVSLTGTGNAPIAGVSTTSLTFSSQNTGNTSAAQTVTLNNTGNTSLTVTSIALTGANPGDYAQTNTCGSSVAAAGSCTISVTFTPTATGTRTASVTITDNTNNVAGSTQTVSLTGTGVAGVGFSPSILTFTTQNVGTTSSAQTITMTNTGSASFTITGISITGANAGDFSQTNTCGSSLAQGANCTISVTFAPTASGTRTASVSIADSLAGSPQTVALTGTGSAPVVSLSASSLTFASQAVGTTSAAQLVTVTNSGTASLTFTSISASSNFSQINTCSTPIAAGGTCAISVTFDAPATVGTVTGTLTITDNNNGVPGSTQTVNLTGTAAPPPPSATSSISFPSQAPGTTSAPQAGTLSSTGSVPLTIYSIVASANFSQSNTCPLSPSTLAGGASCTINVSFAPPAGIVGTLTGTLTITDNAPNSPQTVSLTGASVGPLVSLSFSGLNFNAQALGTTSTAQPVTLTNTGNASLTIASIAVAGANAGDFAQTNTCGSSVAAAGTCTISVTFTPAAEGSRTASVTITDNVVGSPQTVSLTGTGTAPIAGVSPSSVTFSSQNVGTMSAAQTVTLNNTGNDSLSITSIALTGTNSGDYAQTNTCGSSVAASSSCTLNVTFTPTASGSRTASLTITDNSNNVAGSTQTVTLSGTGQDFTFAPPSGGSTTATVTRGATANYTLSVGGQAGFSGIVTFTCTGAPSEAICTPPSQVTAGSTAQNVTVTVTTTAPTLSAPRSRPLPPAPPLSPGVRGLWLLVLALAALAWAIVRRNQPGMGPWRSTFLPLATALLLMMALAGCGGGGTPPVTHDPGTPTGTYTLTVKATTGSGSSALSHSVTLTLTVN